MKKVDESQVQEYLPLVLFIEDMEALEMIFRENAKLQSIVADGYEFESIQELAGKLEGSRIRKFEMRALDPGVSVELHPMWARLYVGSSSTSAVGIFHQLDGVLRRSLRMPSWAYSYKIVVVFNIIALVPLYRTPYLALVIGLLLITWGVRVPFIRLTRHSTILVRRKRAEKSFWVRNQDQLAVATISALIGAMLGVAGTIIAGKLETKAKGQNQVEISR